jgi:heat-inducible transcriptional repressor
MNDTPKPMDTQRSVFAQLNERSRDIFTKIVDAYVETGEPIGSRSLSRRLATNLSPATIRNVMADLEEWGLLYAPHTSAGRLPTDMGLRMFVDGMLDLGQLGESERKEIQGRVAGTGKSVESVLEQATATLSGLSRCAGIVLAPKTDSALKHIEFVNLGPGRALVVMVTADGIVENRLIEVPPDLPASAFIEASNFLTAKLAGRTIAQARADLNSELAENRAQIDQLSSRLVHEGLATWGGDSKGTLIVRGQANLLDVGAIADLERVRALFSAMETGELMVKVLDMADGAEGVRIYIGADNELFNLSGCSFIVAPYQTSNKVVGAIGVIGPTRMNYARIIPMVDYTSKLIGQVLS